MRIISYNVNGIRAAIRKGFIQWLETDPADVICVQEIKAEQGNVEHHLMTQLGFYDYWYPAQKKGYSGVAVFTKIKPDNVQFGSGHLLSDGEGRVIQLDFGNVRLINAYFPSGTMGEERQSYKYRWLDEFLEYLNELRKEHPRLIIAGDYNIAHKEIDIHNPKSNKNTTGFLPAERAWMDKYFENGFIDAFRVFHPQPHQYTWWNTYFPSTRENNKGWRIDYINVTENLKSNLIGAAIMPQVKHSDHCPVYLEIGI